MENINYTLAGETFSKLRVVTQDLAALYAQGVVSTGMAVNSNPVISEAGKRLYNEIVNRIIENEVEFVNLVEVLDSADPL